MASVRRPLVKPASVWPIHHIADQAETRLARALRRALLAFRASITDADLIAAYRQNNPNPLWYSPSWAAAVNTFSRDVRVALEAEIRAAAAYAVRGIPVRKLAPASAEAQAIFTLLNPRAARAALLEGARLVTAVTAEVREAITALIVRMQRGQITVAQGAREMRGVVGLTEAQTTAVYNFRRALEARAGLIDDAVAAERALTDAQRNLLRHRLADTQARIDALVARYEARQLRYRTEMIARTESMRAANRGQQEAWLAARDQGLLTDDVRQVWLVTHDERLCPICEPMGRAEPTPLGQPFTNPDTLEQWMAPPIHPHCLPGDALVFPGGLITAVSERYYQGTMCVLGVANDLPLTCTPNHPILTPHGWVAAGELHEGDEIVKPLWREGIVAGDWHDVHMPSRIEDVARAFSKASGVTAIEVPVSPPDFHGDGVDGQIAIVRANSQLRDQGDPPFRKFPLDKGLFRGRPDNPQLATLGSSLPLSGPDAASPSGGVGRSDLALPLRRGHLLPFEVFSLRPVTDLAREFSQKHTANGAPAATEHFRQSLFTDPALILSNDHVVRKVEWTRHVPFSGMVYNLETTEGYYAANGYASHNCRCSVALQMPQDFSPEDRALAAEFTVTVE